MQREREGDTLHEQLQNNSDYGHFPFRNNLHQREMEHC